jgi:hypothetical protein
VTPLFCGLLCQSGYATDMSLGLIYGPYLLNGRRVSAGEFSATAHVCVYCLAPVCS